MEGHKTRGGATGRHFHSRTTYVIRKDTSDTQFCSDSTKGNTDVKFPIFEGSLEKDHGTIDEYFRQ